jgi:hypothetical protein
MSQSYFTELYSDDGTDTVKALIGDVHSAPGAPSGATDLDDTW